MKRTHQPSAKLIKREWHFVDASQQILGRLSTQIATYLMGKNKADYSANIDSGDYVVVVNCEKIKVTGRKQQQKVYRKHSGYPGGLKTVKYQKLLDENPQRIIINAVYGMLPDNRLKSDRLARLKVFKGDKHPYQDKIK